MPPLDLQDALDQVLARQPVAGAVAMIGNREATLASAASGLGYAFTSGDMARAQGKVTPGSIASLSAPLMFEPGSDWLYGVSTDWVGRAVESASGQTLGAYMAEHIFAPLAMIDTGFAVAAQKMRRNSTLAAAVSIPRPQTICASCG